MRWSAPSRTSAPGVFRAPSRVPYARRRLVLPGKSNPGLLGRITETGTARTLTFYRVTTLARIVETGTARGIDTIRMLEVARITETGTARGLTFSSHGGEVAEPELIFEIAFNAGASTSQYLILGDPTRGLLGVGKLAPSSIGSLGGVWTDVTEYVRQWSVTRPANRVDTPVVQYEAGTCSIQLENHDRRFDPTNLDGPYVDGDTTQVTPMRAIRIRARWDDVVYPIWQGFADAWNIEWHDPGYSLCTVTGTDASKVLAGIRRTAVSAVGAGELAGARIARILDSAEWGDSDRVIDAGTVTVQATTLDGDPLAEMRLISDTEIGELYISPQGKVVFRDRASRTGDENSALLQAEFGDDGDELPYTALRISYDDSTFFNEVKVTRTAASEVDTPVEQTAADATSQGMYMVRTWERTDLIMQTDAQALAYAQYIAARTAEPELRFEQVVVDPRVQPVDLWPQVLGRDYGDRIAITRRPPGGGNPIRRDSWIRGIEHQGDQPSGTWSTTWTLQQAEEGDAPAPAAALRGSVTRRRVAVVARRPRRFQRRRRVQPPVRWR